MNKYLLTLAIICITLGLYVQNSCAESNFDFFFKRSNQYKEVVVQEVISADTIVIENYLKKGEKIELIGLRAPKPPRNKRRNVERDEYGFVIKKKASPLKTIEEEALAFAKELMEGKRLRLELDVQKNSDDHNTLAYAFLIDEDIFVNEEILRQGFANLQIMPPNKKYAERLREAYREARKEFRGLQAA